MHGVGLIPCRSYQCLPGGCKTENGVSVIVANWLIGKGVGGDRYNDRVMKVNIVIGDVV